MTKKTKLDYVSRKVAHWNRMGTPSQIDPETGAAVPLWVLEEREARNKARLNKGRE